MNAIEQTAFSKDFLIGVAAGLFFSVVFVSHVVLRLANKAKKLGHDLTISRATARVLHAMWSEDRAR